MIAFVKLFDFIPGWVYAIALALVVAALGGEMWSHHNTRTAMLTERSVFETLRANAEAESAAQSEKFRAIEQELRNAQDTHSKEVEAVLVNLDRARVDGRVASDRLRDAAKFAASQASAACADSTSAAVRETAGDSIGVLADVLGRADARAGILAEVADRRGIAGRACERAYDEVKDALKHGALDTAAGSQ